MRVSFTKCLWAFTMRLIGTRARHSTWMRQKIALRSMLAMIGYLERNWFRKLLSTLVLKLIATSFHLWWREKTTILFQTMSMRTFYLSFRKKVKNTFNSKISTPTWKFFSSANFSPAWKNATPTTTSSWCRVIQAKKSLNPRVPGAVWGRSRGCLSASKRAWGRKPLSGWHPRNIRLWWLMGGGTMLDCQIVSWRIRWWILLYHHSEYITL